MVLEFLKIFMVGSIIGSLVVRVWFRHIMGVSLVDIKTNLSTSTNRKFRIIELVPFVGTTLTHFKHKGQNVNFAKQAFGMELITGLTCYILVQLVVDIAPLFFSLIWMVILVAIIFGALVKSDYKQQELELERNKNVSVPTTVNKFAGFRGRYNGVSMSNLKR